jgi:hypothetical protein
LARNPRYRPLYVEFMAPEPGSIAALLDAAVTALASLGGVIAAHSGSAAHMAFRRGASDVEIGNRISRGIAESFDFAVYFALIVLIIVLGQ